MEDQYAKMPFEIRAWGCISFIENLVDKHGLEWVYKNKGGIFIFEYIDGKVRGKLSDIKAFRNEVLNYV